MTLLDERLKEAGVNTADARLMALAVDTLRESNGSIPEAATLLWTRLKAESWVARDLWLLPYLRARAQDMKGVQAAPALLPMSATSIDPLHVARVSIARKPPRPIPSPESKAKVERIIQSSIKHLAFGHLTSDGKDWADVGAHELDGMDRDGALARALKDRIGVLSNSDRFKSLGELLTSKAFNEARDNVRERAV